MTQQQTLLNSHRYRLYREHKYVYHVLDQIVILSATLDFSDSSDLAKLKAETNNLALLLKSHAEYEESRIHSLLQLTNPQLINEVNEQHYAQNHFFDDINKQIQIVAMSNSKSERHFVGYEIYLQFRNFFSENLQHFDYEEKVLMPELHRRLTDDEIKEIDRQSYRIMLPEQMIHMIEVLFPHMNREDRLTFLNDIKDCEPEKFSIAWNGISSLIEASERSELIEILDIKTTDRMPDNSMNLKYPWENISDANCLMTSPAEQV
jgi:hypothetical protein